MHHVVRRIRIWRLVDPRLVHVLPQLGCIARARETKNIRLPQRVPNIPIGLEPSSEPNRILAEITSSLGIIVPKTVPIQARFFVFVLARPTKRAIPLGAHARPRHTENVELRLPRERSGLVVHLGRRTEVVRDHAIPLAVRWRGDDAPLRREERSPVPSRSSWFLTDGMERAVLLLPSRRLPPNSACTLCSPRLDVERRARKARNPRGGSAEAADGETRSASSKWIEPLLVRPEVWVCYRIRQP